MLGIFFSSISNGKIEWYASVNQCARHANLLECARACRLVGRSMACTVVSQDRNRRTLLASPLAPCQLSCLPSAIFVDIRGMLHLAFWFRFESMTLLLMYVGYVLIMVSNEPGNPFLYRDLLKGADRLLLRGDEATHQ